MKILYHHRVGSRDGQAVHMEELIAALRSLGHEVLLVGPSSFADAPFGHDPKGIARLKRLAPKFLYELLELAYNIPAYLRLRRACRAFRPDFIYERYNLYGIAGIWCRSLADIPLVLEVNAPLVRERLRFGGLGIPWLAHIIERTIWRKSDFILPVTRVLANEIGNAGVAEERIAVIPNAIDPAKFALDGSGPEAKSDLQLSGRIVLGFTGFVRTWHGLDSILNLLARGESPPNLHCLIVGEGPALAGLKDRARDLGVLDRVTFAGLVSRERISRYVDAFDIALVPSCVEYCSPLKVFEYMAAGKAIVAPDQPNIREILENGVSCLTFEPGCPDSMTAAILQLANDSVTRNRLGSAARALIDSRPYTWRRNAERVTALGAAAAGRARLGSGAPCPT